MDETKIIPIEKIILTFSPIQKMRDGFLIQDLIPDNLSIIKI